MSRTVAAAKRVATQFAARLTACDQHSLPKPSVGLPPRNGIPFDYAAQTRELMAEASAEGFGEVDFASLYEALQARADAAQ